MDTDMKAIRGRLNNMLGAKYNSQLVGYVDKLDQSKIKGAINYTCKYVNVNNAYGFEI